jgi:hypothetical protein
VAPRAWAKHQANASMEPGGNTTPSSMPPPAMSLRAVRQRYRPGRLLHRGTDTISTLAGRSTRSPWYRTRRAWGTRPRTDMGRSGSTDPPIAPCPTTRLRHPAARPAPSPGLRSRSPTPPQPHRPLFSHREGPPRRLPRSRGAGSYRTAGSGGVSLNRHSAEKNMWLRWASATVRPTLGAAVVREETGMGRRKKMFSRGSACRTCR